jgi:integrase
VSLSADLRAELRDRVGKLIPFGGKSSGAFNEAAKRRAGFHFHAHQKRHTFACGGLEKGGSLAALQAVMGHSTIATTMRYARLSDVHVRAEAERLSGRDPAEPAAAGPSSDSQECRKAATAR